MLTASLILPHVMATKASNADVRRLASVVVVVNQEDRGDNDRNRMLSTDEREAEELTEFQEGPMKLLTESLVDQTKVLIRLRNNKRLVGRVRAFDKHWNMVLEGVKELWNGVGQDGKSVPRDRYLGRVFLRGDNLILVLKNPNDAHE